jgi:prophage maintenance system killer protein
MDAHTCLAHPFNAETGLDTGHSSSSKSSPRLPGRLVTSIYRPVGRCHWPATEFDLEMGRYRLKLDAIEESLRYVQKNFAQINETFNTRRDIMRDEIVANMMSGYTFVDDALEAYPKIDLMEFKHSKYILELNFIVLCGENQDVRWEHRSHIEATTERFYNQAGCNIRQILDWYRKHRKDSPWKRTAGVYIQLLSRPQLFIEGNHRTGALIMSYLLARDGKAPFVLSAQNAKAYFDPSTLIKATQKNWATQLVRLPKIKKRFARFLEKNAEINDLYTEEIDKNLVN